MSFRLDVLRYERGVIQPAKLPEIAVAALEEGLDSPALRMLASQFGSVAYPSEIESLYRRSLAELDLPRTTGVTAVALSRAGQVTLNPPDAEVLRVGDELIVAGSDDDLERLPTTTQRGPAPS